MRVFVALAISIVITMLLCAGCTSRVGETPAAITTPVSPVPSTAGPTIPPGQPDISIAATPGRYSPLMSSTVGIRLSTGYTESVPVLYNWTADYGHFVTWNAPDYRVIIDGQNIVTDQPSVYWSYPPDDMGIQKPPVTIRLVIETKRLTHGGTRGTIAWKEIRIGWEGNDTAVAEI